MIIPLFKRNKRVDRFQYAMGYKRRIRGEFLLDGC
jgi:hypothetical protein